MYIEVNERQSRLCDDVFCCCCCCFVMIVRDESDVVRRSTTQVFVRRFVTSSNTVLQLLSVYSGNYPLDLSQVFVETDNSKMMQKQNRKSIP